MAQVAAIVLLAASQIHGGISALQAGNAQAKALNANADRAITEGEQQALEVTRQERAVSGEAMVALADGGMIGSGAAMDLITQNAMNREMDVMTARYNARVQSASLRGQAAQAKMAGRAAMFGGMLKAGASVLSGVNDMNNQSRLEAAQANPGGQRLPIPGALG